VADAPLVCPNCGRVFEYPSEPTRLKVVVRNFLAMALFYLAAWGVVILFIVLAWRAVVFLIKVLPFA
jgi:hypothetical protein